VSSAGQFLKPSATGAQHLTSPPVAVNLFGLEITASNIQTALTARTGDCQILGNLVYNVSHLLDPGGSLNLLGILGQLGL
jgi:hypothetical protein